jgi:hypothetical protein
MASFLPLILIRTVAATATGAQFCPIAALRST